MVDEVGENEESESKEDQGRGRGREEGGRGSTSEGYQKEEECRNDTISQELWTTSQPLREEAFALSKRNKSRLRRFGALEIARCPDPLDNSLLELRRKVGERLATTREEIG